jgi:CelD/BcsL family acetyltransferase involved in cellulose biosynthesis
MHITQHLDEGAWRDFVAGNARGNIFHTPEMFDVFARTKEFKPSLWASVGDDGRVLALLLPAQVTVLSGPLRYLTTRAVAYGSVLCAPGPEGQAALAVLLQTYNRAVKGSVLFTELRNLSDLSDWQPALNAQGYCYEEHLNFLIDLTRPQDKLWKNIRSNARRNIQKAQKEGVLIEEIDDPNRLPVAYALLRAVYKRIQVPLPDISLFQAAFEILRPRDMLRILIAKVNGADIGALTLLVSNGMMTYWYTGTLREYASYRANDLLVWRALELGIQMGCHTFDFGGGGRPDEEYGVRDFKAKFGGELVNYGRNTCVHAALRLKFSRAGYELMRRFL